MKEPDARTVELRHLRHFLAVYRELHFSRAAASLHMAQPPLSYSIRKLETALGVRLFDRTSRAVVPTEAGHAFAEGARKVLAGMTVAIADARHTGGAGSTLRIGCTPELPIDDLLEFLSLLVDRMPDIEPHVQHLASADQISQLHSRELDLGIVELYEDRRGLETAALFRGAPLATLLPSGHALAGNGPVSPADLRHETLVIVPRTGNAARHEWLLAELERAGYRFASVREADGPSPRDLVLAVASGLGVAIVPDSPAEVAGAGTVVTTAALDPALRLPGAAIVWQAESSKRIPDVLASIRETAEASTAHLPGSSDRRRRH